MSARDFEDEVLGVVRLQLRRAMRLKAAIHITIDPWLVKGMRGATIFAGPDEHGHSYEIADGKKARRRRR